MCFAPAFGDQEESMGKINERCGGIDVGKFQGAFQRLQTIPGVGQLAAASILAETGVDLTTFPTAEKMASSAGLYPGNRESAGIKKGSLTTQGNSYLRTTLVQCAWSATRKTGCIFQTRFRDLSPRRGQKRAIVAIAHQMLTVLHFMLKNNPTQRRQRRAHHHLRCLRRLGISVQIADAAYPY